MKNIYVPFPTIEEQNQILEFLRWKTSVFNGLIPEKAITKGNIIASSKSLLAREMMLIDEYRTSLISAAVTGQIDVRVSTLVPILKALDLKFEQLFDVSKL